MSEDLDVKVARLKRRISEAQQRKAKAEAQAESARDRVEQAAREIREEFGISPEAAPAQLNKLKDDLAAEAERVREALERAESSD